MPEVDVDEIMKKLREEIQRRKGLVSTAGGMGAGQPAPASAPSSERISLPRPRVAPSFQHKSEYHVRDFLVYHDGDLVRNAYLGLLQREPDPSGYEQYLKTLRDGERGKIEILGRIRYSSEGRVRNVKIRGLVVPFAFSLACRVPLVAYLLRMAAAVARLSVSSEKWESVRGPCPLPFRRDWERLRRLMFKH